MSSNKPSPIFLKKLKYLIFLKSDKNVLPKAIDVDFPLEELILIPISYPESIDNSIIETFVFKNILTLHKLGLLKPMIDNVVAKKMMNSKYSAHIYYKLSHLSKRQYTDDDVESLFKLFGEAANKKLYPKSLKQSGAVMISELLRDGVYSTEYLELYKTLFKKFLKEKDTDNVLELLRLFFRRSFVYWAFNLDPNKYKEICKIDLLKDTDWQLWLQNDKNTGKVHNCEIDTDLLSVIQDELTVHNNGDELQRTLCSKDCTALLKNFFGLIINCGKYNSRIIKIVNQERVWMTNKMILGGFLVMFTVAFGYSLLHGKAGDWADYMKSAMFGSANTNKELGHTIKDLNSEKYYNKLGTQMRITSEQVKPTLESELDKDKPVLESEQENPVLESEQEKENPVLESELEKESPVLESEQVKESPVLESEQEKKHGWGSTFKNFVFVDERKSNMLGDDPYKIQKWISDANAEVAKHEKSSPWKASEIAQAKYNAAKEKVESAYPNTVRAARFANTVVGPTVLQHLAKKGYLIPTPATLVASAISTATGIPIHPAVVASAPALLSGNFLHPSINPFVLDMSNKYGAPRASKIVEGAQLVNRLANDWGSTVGQSQQDINDISKLSTGTALGAAATGIIAAKLRRGGTSEPNYQKSLRIAEKAAVDASSMTMERTNTHGSRASNPSTPTPTTATRGEVATNAGADQKAAEPFHAAFVQAINSHEPKSPIPKKDPDFIKYLSITAGGNVRGTKTMRKYTRNHKQKYTKMNNQNTKKKKKNIKNKKTKKKCICKYDNQKKQKIWRNKLS